MAPEHTAVRHCHYKIKIFRFKSNVCVLVGPSLSRLVYFSLRRSEPALGPVDSCKHIALTHNSGMPFVREVGKIFYFTLFVGDYKLQLPHTRLYWR